MEEKQKKRSTVGMILFGLLIVICVIGIYFGYRGIRFLLWEEDTNRSSLDERYVSEDNSIMLEAADIAMIQPEVLAYISEWEKIRGLSYVNVYLGSDLEVSSLVFVYGLEPADEYIGRLEVKCDAAEDGNWEIARAESYYNYDDEQSQGNHENEWEDGFLAQKIQAITDYIAYRREQRVDLYLISINGSSVHIDAHNVENESTQNNWREDCTLYQDGNDYLLNP